jgi:DNA polymerase III delta subunit
MIFYRDKALNIINSSKNIPRCWLIFGSDEGEIRVLTQKIIDKVKTDQHEFLKTSDISSLKQNFIERSLFQTNKIAVFEGATDASTQDVEKAFHSMLPDDYLIVCAEELKKISKLRTLFEKHDEFVALNCYKMDLHAIAGNIERDLRANGIKFAQDIPMMIASIVSSDSKVIENELEKIILYLADSLDKKLTAEMVMEIVSINSEAALDKLFISAVLNRRKSFLQEFDKTSQLTDIFVIRAYQNFIIRIISVQRQLSKIGIENAMNNLKPPLFGRQRSDFIEAVQKSDIQNNIRLLNGAIQIECDLKSSFETKTLLLQNIIEQCSR